VIQKIRTQFLEDNNFKPHIVAKASKAAKGLCEWIIGMDNYYNQVKIINPMKDALEKAIQRSKIAKAELDAKTNELKVVQMDFERKQKELREAIDQKQ
jgi:dynein heavy chain, axonemal